MKIVNFKGGIGNQMFQYAFLLRLQKECVGEEVLMDCSEYLLTKTHRVFEINKIFNISAETTNLREQRKYKSYHIQSLPYRIYFKLFHQLTDIYKEKSSFDYYPEVFKEHKRFFDGYWQNHEYFDNIKDKVLQEFQFKKTLDATNMSIFQRILSERNSVSIHVRRGDFLNHEMYIGICGKYYYEQAIDKVFSFTQTSPHFYIFSNDMDWCVNNIIPLTRKNEVTLVDWNKGRDSYKDMQLMAACHTNIIANSSFSWWAAYLNPHEKKTVYAPQTWSNEKYKFKIQMPEWILI